MLYQQVVVAILAVVLLNVLLNLWFLRKTGHTGKLPDSLPLISVLIPARDEEANIGACLDSLCRQDYPNYEILVLDDASTDGTADIVEKVAREDSRVKLLHGQPLPQGWAGKTFACHQLAQQARGSWLLFVDADTVHAPSTLRHVMSLAVRYDVELVSGFLRQRLTSILQKMVMPILFYFLLCCGILFWWLPHSRLSLPSYTIGQFLFFSARAYRDIGGHEAVKSSVIEDVWLGIEMSRHHHRQLTIDLSSLVSCCMYRDVGSMWAGICRWAYSAPLLVLIWITVVVLLLCLGPFLCLGYGLLFGEPVSGWLALVVAQVIILLLARFLVGRHFYQSLLSTILHPVGIVTLLLIVLHTGYQHLTGTGVAWKGRLYDAESDTRYSGFTKQR